MVRATHAEDSERPCLPQVVGRRQSISMHPWQARHRGHRHHQNTIAIPPTSGDRVELSKEPDLASRSRADFAARSRRRSNGQREANTQPRKDLSAAAAAAQLPTAAASARSAMPSACRSWAARPPWAAMAARSAAAAPATGTSTRAFAQSAATAIEAGQPAARQRTARIVPSSYRTLSCTRSPHTG